MRKRSKILSGVLAVAMMIAMTACGGTATVEDTVQEPVAEQKQETVSDNSTEVQEASTVEDEESQEANSQDTSAADTALSEPVDITIAAVGGMYFNEDISAASIMNGYSYFFEDVKYFLEESDIAIGVTQTPVADGEQYDIAEAIKNTGFDVINVASANCYDDGVEGLNRIMGALMMNEVKTSGAQTNANHFDKIAYVDVKGVKVAFISGCQGVEVTEDTVDINSVDEAVLIGQIDEAKTNGADVIVVSLNYPNKVDGSEEELAMKLGEAGAHLVLVSGIKKAEFVTETLIDDEGNPVVEYIGNLGSFLINTQNISMITRVTLTVNEDGTVDFYNGDRLDYLPFSFNYSDHWKLTPITEDDLDGNWTDDEKEFIEWALR